MKGNPYEENIPNTFAPLCRKKMLSIADIIEGLRWGFFKSEKLPSEIKLRVNAEINRRVVIFDKIMSRSVHSELVNPPFNGRFKRM